MIFEAIGPAISESCPYPIDISQDGQDVGVVVWRGEHYTAIVFDRSKATAERLRSLGGRMARSLDRAKPLTA